MSCSFTLNEQVDQVDSGRRVPDFGACFQMKNKFDLNSGNKFKFEFLEIKIVFFFSYQRSVEVERAEFFRRFDPAV